MPFRLPQVTTKPRQDPTSVIGGPSTSSDSLATHAAKASKELAHSTTHDAIDRRRQGSGKSLPVVRFPLPRGCHPHDRHHPHLLSQ